ncbi:related to DEP1 protein, regulator of phospholipid metabolism [Cephalotrichum gorgonifer]|uniref:Related to DEP1 protein, regulator of phospholipid metabolism n=1 Tax=Cephalotrichum gorgonifer TaxID=2041049 RepID=A0AAE8SU72_9PEZI|nr:related to DEP1 protein, regulator of phospholipid metabolism [Cephalotrichum gorgonifer]
MAATTSAPPTLSTSHPIADGEDSNLSSPLSEVDDKDEEPDDLDSMTLDHLGPPGDPSDSDSVLSEANDTEAETERLYDTPQVSRQKNLILNEMDEDEDSFEKTPTKPSTVVVGGADLDADDSLSDVEMSAPPSSPPDERMTPIQATRIPSPNEKVSISEAKKRKRSLGAERSDSEAPLRKRTGSVGVASQGAADKVVLPTDGDAKSNEPSSLQSPAGASPQEHGDSTEGAQREDSIASEPVIPKKMTRNGSKQAKAAIVDGADNEAHDGLIEDDAEGRQEDEGVEGDAEEDLDAAARHDEEEAERKRIAFGEWTGIEEKFSIFRDRLYKDRLEKLEREEQALTADVPYHAEYLNMKRCLDDLHEEKIRKINKEYEYVLNAHDEVAVSRRAMVWGQFYQGVRETRERLLSELNREWHDTQNARRHAHSAPDFAIMYPPTPAQRVRNAVAYNTEVSILSGIAKHVGFPAAPSMFGATMDEVEDDLDAIKKARRQRQQSMMQHNSSYPNALDSAGEQFIRNTPWANPSHPHHQSQKAAAGPSSDNHGGVQVKTARVNGGQSLPPEKSRNRVSSVSPEATRSPATTSQGHMKRVKSLQGTSNTPTKASHEPSTAKRELLAASSGS